MSKNIKGISDQQALEISKEVSNIYNVYDEGRQPHNDDIKALQKLIYEAPSTEIKFGDTVVLPTLYKLNDTLSSYINGALYSILDNSFDVYGNNEESEGNAQKHKHDIINSLTLMDYKNKMRDEAVANFCLSGEFCLVMKQEEKSRYKRKFDFNVADLVDIINPFKDEKEERFSKVEKEAYYDGCSFDVIKSQDFVIDETKNLFIRRMFLSYQQVIGNSAYDITDDQKELFKQKAFAKKPSIDELQDDQSLDENRSGDTNGLLEVLEYWGDFEGIIENEPLYLENKVITIVEGKLVRCIDNPFFETPYVYYAPIKNPNTKRGISPLRVAVIPNAINSNIANVMLDLLALQRNKPKVVIEGTVVENDWEDLTEGKLLKLNQKALMNDFKFQELDFSSGLNASIQALPLFENEIQSSTGLYDNMAGAMTPTGRTATELNLAATGGSIRVNNLTDKITSCVNIKFIEKVARYKANMDSEEKEITYVNGDSGKREFIKIDSKVRQGDYTYTYTDSKTAAQRQNSFNDYLAFTKQFIELDPTEFNIKEIYKYGANMKNIPNVDKFINKDKMDEAFATLQKELQMQPQDVEIIKDKLLEQLPMILEGLTNEGQQTRSPEQAIQQQGMAGGNPIL